MATRQPSDVTRSGATVVAAKSEVIETGRDLLGSQSRLRLHPTGRWCVETDSLTTKVWEGYGHTVRLESSGITRTWRVELERPDGVSEVIADDVSRIDAFRAAADQMRQIAMRD